MEATLGGMSVQEKNSMWAMKFKLLSLIEECI
jgi:hypothetical protein